MAPWNLVICINACAELIRSMFIPNMGHLAVLPHLMQTRHCDWAYPRTQTVSQNVHIFHH